MDIDKYTKTLTVGEAEKRRARVDITEFVEFLSKRGRTWPEQSDYEDYRAQKSATDKNPRTTTDRIRRIKRYFSTKEGEITMTKNENKMTEEIRISPEAEKIAEQGEYMPAEVEAPETTETTPHIGRPRKSPQCRDKKITIYLTPEVVRDLQDLARIEGTTTPDYVFRLIELEADRRKEDLETIRKMRKIKS